MNTRQAQSFRRPESVLVLVFTRTGQVLLIQRSDLPDFWQSVTGTLEPGETPAAAAARELYEETGLSGVDLTDRKIANRYRIKAHWSKRYAPGTTHNTEHVFTVEMVEQVSVHLNPEEHLSFEWLDAEAALDRCSSPTNQAAIQRFVLKLV
ncbi:MAG: dihydroneopterin triphosphate diphosphatase [Gammaproteobacteria bacterium]|nr:dihydroneopterin triphosphate diphosphatase [Gammaproteobacteria bacterium]